MAKTAAAPTAFTGFDRNALAFFHELSVEMNRDWFLANKERYEPCGWSTHAPSSSR